MMDELLKEIEVSNAQNEFIKEVHEKAGDPSFRERGKAILTFYTLEQTKKLIDSFRATVDRVARTINDINKSTLEMMEKIITANKEIADSAKGFSRKMTIFTAGLFFATAGLVFLGFVQLFKG